MNLQAKSKNTEGFSTCSDWITQDVTERWAEGGSLSEGCQDRPLWVATEGESALCREDSKFRCETDRWGSDPSSSLFEVLSPSFSPDWVGRYGRVLSRKMKWCNLHLLETTLTASSKMVCGGKSLKPKETNEKSMRSSRPERTLPWAKVNTFLSFPRWKGK